MIILNDLWSVTPVYDVAGDNEEENFVKENSAPTSARQSQTVKLVFSDDELGQSDLNEHDFSPTGKAIELVFEEVQPGGSMGSGIVEAAHIIESQPDDIRIHSIPLNVDDKIFESSTPQELQNQSRRIDYSFREEWQKDDGQRINYNRSNREDEAAAALFSAWRWEHQASSRCFQDVFKFLLVTVTTVLQNS